MAPYIFPMYAVIKDTNPEINSLMDLLKSLS